jgi:hypothetical protein
VPEQGGHPDPVFLDPVPQKLDMEFPDLALEKLDVVLQTLSADADRTTVVHMPFVCWFSGYLSRLRLLPYAPHPLNLFLTSVK